VCPGSPDKSNDSSFNVSKGKRYIRESFSIDPDEANPEKTMFRCIATIALFVTATAHADQLTPLELDRYPEPTSVMAPAPEPPAAWFYERFQIPTHAITLQQAAALRQLQSEMDSGYQPYVFCCGGPGDAVVSREHRVPLSGEILSKYRLMPGQIIDSVAYQRIAEEVIVSQNREAQSNENNFFLRR
jgi:hypothetical protein